MNEYLNSTKEEKVIKIRAQGNYTLILGSSKVAYISEPIINMFLPIFPDIHGIKGFENIYIGPYYSVLTDQNN